MPAANTSTAMPMNNTRLAGATYQNGLSGASTGVAFSVASVNFVLRALGRHQVHERHRVRPRLHGVGGRRLHQEVRPDRVSGCRQLDDPRHHPAPQDVVGQILLRALDPHLHAVGGLRQVRQPGRRTVEPDGSLGLPSSSPVIRMMTTGTSVPIMSRRRSPMARRRFTQMTASTYGSTIRRTRVMARPPATTAMISRITKGPMMPLAGSPSWSRPEPDQGPTVRRAEREHLEGVGERAGWRRFHRQAPGRGRRAR